MWAHAYVASYANDNIGEDYIPVNSEQVITQAAILPLDNNTELVVSHISSESTTSLTDTVTISIAPNTSTDQKFTRINPAAYKVLLPVTYYEEVLMQWLPSKLLSQKYADMEKSFYEHTRKSAIMKKQQKVRQLATQQKDTATLANSMVWPKVTTDLKSHINKKTPLTLEIGLHAWDEFISWNNFLNKRLFTLYYAQPQLIKKWEYKINQLTIYNPPKEELVKPKVGISELFRMEPIAEAAPVEDVGSPTLIRPSMWRHSGSGSLKVSQLYVSDNWYKGGESNLNILGELTLKYNYDDQRLVKWDNTFELKEGLNTASSDQVHNIRMNTDMFRITSKLGLRAFQKNWYYSLSSQFSTQFFNTYEPNSHTRLSALLSPSFFSSGLGMEYTIKKKKVDFSTVVSLLNYDMRFVVDRQVNETRFGIESGKFSRHFYGTRINSTFEWRITPIVKYKGRFDGFTNYEYTEGSLESTIDFAINRYLTTSFFFHARFDDNVKRSDAHGYFQYRDLFNFGLNYTW